MKFFVLKDPAARPGDDVTDYVSVDGSRIGDAPRCPVCGKFVGMLPLLPPVRVEIKAWGSRWGDVVFGPGGHILISQKLKSLFATAGLAGFTQLDPVEIVKAKTRRTKAGEPPRYWLASIKRGVAAINEEASGLVRDETPRCEACRIGGITKRISRIVFEADTWSGEDVFIARGLPGRILVSERFKRLREDNNLANFCLVAADAFSFDHYPQDRESR